MDTNNCNVKLQNTSYDLSQTTLKILKNIEINGWSAKYNYSGQVNKDNQPHGFGRAIATSNYLFIDA